MEHKRRLIFKKLTKNDFDDIDEEKQEKIPAEMLLRDTVVVLAADPKSHESFYLIKMGRNRRGETEDGRCGRWFWSRYQERDEVS